MGNKEVIYCQSFVFRRRSSLGWNAAFFHGWCFRWDHPLRSCISHATTKSVWDYSTTRVFQAIPAGGARLRPCSSVMSLCLVNELARPYWWGSVWM